MQPIMVSMAKKIYGFAEIVESFLTWNEGETKTVQCVTMENISHSDRINKFHIKSKGSLTQINAASVLQYQESCCSTLCYSKFI